MSISILSTLFRVNEAVPTRGENRDFVMLACAILKDKEHDCLDVDMDTGQRRSRISQGFLQAVDKHRMSEPAH